MLCYRCGSHVPDGTDTCPTCGQKFDLDTSSAHTPGASLAPHKLSTIPHEGSAFQNGTVLASRFRIDAFVGVGPLGQVYKATDQETEQSVALKAISPRLMQTSDERKAFAKEIRLARKLSHPNLACVYDNGEENNWPFFTMQFIEGPTLRQIIDLRKERGETFRLRELEPIFSSLAAALTAAHEVGPHCGVKPENIVVLPDELKLTGFGLGLALPRLPFVAAQKSVKADVYLAPEFTASQDAVTGSADVYALGVIMGEMLSGVLPDDKEQVPDPRSKNPDLPPEVTALYKRTLNENPRARPASPADFLRELSALIAEFDSAEPEESTPVEAPSAAVPPTIPPVPGQAHPSGTAHASPPPLPGHPSATPSGTSLPPPIPKSGKPSASDNGDFVVDLSGNRPGRTSAKVNKAEQKKTSVLPGMIVGALIVGGVLCTAWILLNRAGLIGQQPEPSEPPLVPAVAVTAPAVQPASDTDAGTAALPQPPQADKSDQAISGTKAPVKTPGNPALAAAVDSAVKGKDAADSSSAAGNAAPADGSKTSSDNPAAASSEGSESGSKQEFVPASKSGLQASGTKLDDAADAPDKSGKADNKSKDAGEGTKKPVSGASGTKSGGSCPSKNMVLIPAGTFSAGTASDDPMRSFGERNLQKVKVPAFCIDTYEFPNIRGRTPKGKISYQLAEAACQKEGKRLCTEDEWERACKGPQNYVFPYDNTFQSGKCNTQDSYGTSQPVKASGANRYCASGYLVFDLSGNMAEWTSTPYTAKGSGKVIKGGAANRPDYASRCSARRNGPTNSQQTDEMVGFRCCADPASKK